MKWEGVAGLAGTLRREDTGGELPVAQLIWPVKANMRRKAAAQNLGEHLEDWLAETTGINVSLEIADIDFPTFEGDVWWNSGRSGL